MTREIPRLAAGVLARMYEKAAVRLMREFDLHSPAEVPVVSSWDEAKSGVILGASKPLGLQDSLIVGGPCIDHCGARLEKLRVNVFADLLWPLAAALRLGRPCCVCLFAPLEQVTGPGDPVAEAWTRICDRLQVLAEDTARRLGLQGLSVARFDAPSETESIETWADLVGQWTTPQELFGLYSIGSGQGRKPVSPGLLRSYERNVAGYLPGWLSELLGRTFESVIAVENVQQARAIRKAREVNRRLHGRGNIGHIAYLTPPSLTCRSRMSRSPSAALLVGEPESAWRRRVGEAHPLAREFWMSWCPAETLETLQARDCLSLMARMAATLLGEAAS